MSWVHYLFGFSGRLSRARYWAFVLVSFLFYLAGVVVALPYIILVHPTTSDVPQIPSPLLLATICGEGIVALTLAVAVLAIIVKRLHDRNKSAWWLLLFYAIPAVLDMIASPRMIRTTYHDDRIAALVSTAAALISLWGLVEIGFLKGTAGYNRYGPDPLAST